MSKFTKHTESAGGIVLNKNGMVLIVNQRGTSWSLPKGHIEKGEDKITAAIREIKEESGVGNLTLLKELGFYERYKLNQNGGDDTSELKKIHMMLFTTTDMDLHPTDPHNPMAIWAHPDEVAKVLTHQKDKDFFIKMHQTVNDYLNAS